VTFLRQKVSEKDKKVSKYMLFLRLYKVFFFGEFLV